MPATLRDLEITGKLGGQGITIRAPSTIERVTIQGGVALDLQGPAIVRDVSISNFAAAILMSTGSQLTLDRVMIRGGGQGIVALSGAGTVQLTNLVVSETSGLALDLPGTSGYIEAATIAHAGSDGGSGPRAVVCSSGLTVRSSIIWAPGTTSRAPIAGCNLISSIAGPTAVAGASSSDPKFVDPANGDFHLLPNSPARDAVDAGPATDFEGDPRPAGARFDIGADEAMP